MILIELLFKLSDKFDRLVRLFREDIRDNTPVDPISLLFRLSERLDRLHML
jgi:hypothetical protein